MTNLPREGIRLLLEDVKYVSLPSDSSEGQRTLIEKGDILISITAELGKIAYVAESLGEAYVNQHVALVRIASSDADSKFIAHYLSSRKQRNRWNVIGDAGAKAGLNLKAIGEFPILLPPLPEQRAIADTLSTWDAAIEKTERLIAAKERWISGFGKQLFRRGRENSRLGWKTVALHEVLHEHGDVSTGNESVYSVSVHKGLVDQIEHLGRSFAAANTSNYNRVHFGDVVYTKSPTGDFPLGIFKQSTVDNDVIVSPLYGVFTPQTFELGVILDFFFSSPVNAKNYLNPLIQKGAKNTISITNTTFLRGQICLPMDLGEQKKMCDLIQATRNEMRTLQSILDKLKLQKRGLMQKLLTGTWRVPVRHKVAS